MAGERVEELPLRRVPAPQVEPLYAEEPPAVRGEREAVVLRAPRVGADRDGVELCAALKNVYAIALGIADGMSELGDQPFHDLKAAAFARALAELRLLLDAEGAAAVHRRLGPDPLRADADPQEFVSGVRRRRKAVGELLMDQSVISGVGNIFRAETLLRCGISPFRAGNRLSEARLRAVWDDLVPLMEYGVATGFITTVEADDVPEPLPDDDQEAGRWYVYHRTGRPCLRCGTPVREREAAGRRLFWCPACQAR